MSYPLPRADDGDARFTGELIDGIAQLLADHGFPPVADDTDFARLRDTLADFLYGPEFDLGDNVTWYRNGTVWTGFINAITGGDEGPIARVLTEIQPDGIGRLTATVPCSELTRISNGGAR